MKETIRKSTVDGHVCSRGPSKHDEYLGYVSNPIVPRRCWAPGSRALELTKPVFLQCEICTEYVYAGLFFETKTSWTYFRCTDKYCLNAVKTVDCELEAPSGGFTVPFKP